MELTKQQDRAFFEALLAEGYQEEGLIVKFPPGGWLRAGTYKLTKEDPVEVTKFETDPTTRCYLFIMDHVFRMERIDD